MATSKSMTGAEVKVYINGRIYPYIVSIRWTGSYGRQEIMAIDQNEPAELAPGSTSISGTFDVVRIRNSGGLQGAGIAAPEDKLLLERYFSLVVVDRVSDTTLLKIDNGSVSDESWSVPSRGTITGSVSFKGLGWGNEAP
jgi:hypothetical protein